MGEWGILMAVYVVLLQSDNLLNVYMKLWNIINLACTQEGHVNIILNYHVCW